MNIDDMVLISIDDHVVEPPDMFDGRVPAKWTDLAPSVVKGEDGIERWIYRGRPTGVSGLNAVVSWPAEEWNKNPASFAMPRRIRMMVRPIWARPLSSATSRWPCS